MWRARPLSSIEFRHLRYFFAAAEHGSFRKAGLALSVRESSISRGIGELEARLGASLFERQLVGASLNPAGKRFLQEARMAVRHLGEGVRAVGAIGRSESGQLSIGILSSLASGFLSELLRSYSRDYAGVAINFIEGSAAEHVAGVRQRSLDIAFTTTPAECCGWEIAHLWSEQIFAVLPAAHRLADQRALLWSDLTQEMFIVSEQVPGHAIHDYLFKRFADLGTPLDVRRQNVGRDSLMSLVAIGYGLTLTSEASTAACIPGVVYRQIVGETVPFSAIWSPKNDNPALRRLLSMARARRKFVEPSELPIVLPTLQPSDERSRTPDRSP